MGGCVVNTVDVVNCFHWRSESQAKLRTDRVVVFQDANRRDRDMDKAQVFSPRTVIALSLLLSVVCDLAEASPVDVQQEDARGVSEVHNCIQGGVINWATQKAAQEYFRILQSGVKTNQTQVRIVECQVMSWALG